MFFSRNGKRTTVCIARRRKHKIDDTLFHSRCALNLMKRNNTPFIKLTKVRFSLFVKGGIVKIFFSCVAAWMTSDREDKGNPVILETLVVNRGETPVDLTWDSFLMRCFVERCRGTDKDRKLQWFQTTIMRESRSTRQSSFISLLKFNTFAFDL